MKKMVGCFHGISERDREKERERVYMHVYVC